MASSLSHPSGVARLDAGVRSQTHTRPCYARTARRSNNRFKCWAFAASSSTSEQSQPERISSKLLQPSAQDKYERILAFVDAHATAVVDNAWSGSCGMVSSQMDETLDDGCWHHSYDEEAEEGDAVHEPIFLSASAGTPVVAAAADAGFQQAASHAVSWSYGDATHAKPFFYAWDEEAEGAFELESSCSTSAAAIQQHDLPAGATAVLRAHRRAALHDARHAARASRRMRRSQLHPQLGDLEHMPAWVAAEQQLAQQQGSRNSTSGMRYQQLLALVAGDSATGQYRKPKQWHLTFDEDVHGPSGPETVLGSC